MPPRVSFSGALGVSLAAIALTAVFAIGTLPALVVAVAPVPSSQTNTEARLESLMALHAKSMDQSRQRFVGRSPFFPPPSRIVQKPGPTSQPASTQAVIITPTPPVVYCGPRLIGLYGNEAWFRINSVDELILRIPIGHELAGVGVVETNPPWSAKVAFGGNEFDLTLWNRTTDEYFVMSTPPPVRGIRTQTSQSSSIDGGSR